MKWVTKVLTIALTVYETPPSKHPKVKSLACCRKLTCSAQMRKDNLDDIIIHTYLLF